MFAPIVETDAPCCDRQAGVTGGQTLRLQNDIIGEADWMFTVFLTVWMSAV